MSGQDQYEGLTGASGEHRSTGERAWCFECQEWCYPELPCQCCARTTPEALRRWVQDLLEETGSDDMLVSRAQLCAWALAVEDEVGLDEVAAQMRDVAGPAS